MLPYRFHVSWPLSYPTAGSATVFPRILLDHIAHYLWNVRALLRIGLRGLNCHVFIIKLKVKVARCVKQQMQLAGPKINLFLIFCCRSMSMLPPVYCDYSSISTVYVVIKAHASIKVQPLFSS